MSFASNAIAPLRRSAQCGTPSPLDRDELPMSRVAERIGQHLRAVDVELARFAAQRIVASSATKDRIRIAPARAPTQLEWTATAYHESAHAVAAWSAGASILELRVRAEDATGLCRITEIDKAEDRITFALAGIVAEAKYNPAAVHRYQAGSYDLLVARLLIDTWNEGCTWPPLTCDAAARRALAFVEENFARIANVALALSDAGELDDHAVKVFAGCR
jgi:hypothetical protein